MSSSAFDCPPESGCPDESLILEFVQGDLSHAERVEVENHIAACEECRGVVSELVRAISRVNPALVPGEGIGHEMTLPAGQRPGSGLPKPGAIVVGKYAIEAEIGRGGMGVVFAAKHLHLGQRVALKFLNESARGDAQAVQRFLREAQAAVRIQSEHVARVLDVGTTPDGLPFMVMEYLRGTDLGAWMKKHGAAPCEEACHYVLQACDALAEAHALGLVHRDLKPANLFLTERADGSPLVKVLDFGISKSLREGVGEHGMTTGHVIMGSPRYMSPEQMKSSRDVDARTDIWALGAVLYELISGRPAFEADTVPGLCAAIATCEPAPLAHAPSGLGAVVFRCLEKDPARRFPDVAAFCDALLPFVPLVPAAGPLVARIRRLAERRSSLPDATPNPTEDPSARIEAAVVSIRPGASRRVWTRTLAWASVIAVVALVGVALFAREPWRAPARIASVDLRTMVVTASAKPDAVIALPLDATTATLAPGSSKVAADSATLARGPSRATVGGKPHGGSKSVPRTATAPRPAEAAVIVGPSHAAASLPAPAAPSSPAPTSAAVPGPTSAPTPAPASVFEHQGLLDRK